MTIFYNNQLFVLRELSIMYLFMSLPLTQTVYKRIIAGCVEGRLDLGWLPPLRSRPGLPPCHLEFL